MRQVIRLLLIPGVVGWLLSGCSEKLDPKPLTYSQLLTGTEKKSWKMVSVVINDDGQSSGVIPVSQLNLDPCNADDLVTFYANPEHKLEASEGATKCTANAPDIFVTDDWTLVNASSSLTFYIPVLDGKYVSTIKTLTDKVLTVELYFGDINASYRFTFNSITK